jgi:uncharacterized protein YqhQ
MGKKNCGRYSGIGGQAVMEGIMMKNKDNYAVAVRTPEGEVTVKSDSFSGMLAGSRLKELPFIRGIFNFIDSMVLGMKCLNYSASFYEEDEDTGSKAQAQKEQEAETEAQNKKGQANADGGSSQDKFMTVAVTCVAVAMAVGIFVVLPYYLASFLGRFVPNQSLLAVLEGVVRILIFILYVWGISAMKDIRRLYAYHGAEHKCINCIESGKPLTVENVMDSSRLHKRCGTSFIFFVFFVSIILFFFIRVENPLARVGLRILLMPVVAGISYEIIRLAGRSDFFLVRLISAPGMAIQRMTTREPDESMAEVAIAAVEAVFDWKAYLRENFGEKEPL